MTHLAWNQRDRRTAKTVGRLLVMSALGLAASPAFSQSAPAPAPSTQDQAERDALKRAEALEKEQRELLRQLRDSGPVNSAEPSIGPLNPAELLRAEAEINRRIAAEAKLPKRGHLTPSTREVALATYFSQFSHKIECAGEKNYPPAAKGGTFKAIVKVSVLPDGAVEKIVIDRSTGSPQVDQAIGGIVRAAAPFDKFPPTIRERYGVLDMTSLWAFSRAEDDKKQSNC